MKLLILLLSIAFLSLSCSPEETGFGGMSSIIANVTIPDSLSSKTLPAINAQVYVGFGIKPTSTDYNHKTTTDSLGNFSVKNLFDADNNYNLLIIYKLKVNGFDVTYKKELIAVLNSSTQTIMLVPDKNIGRIQGIVKANIISPGLQSPVSNATVCIGYNYLPNSTKYNFKLITDINGQFSTPFIDLSDSINYKFFASYQPLTSAVLSNTATYTEFITNNKTIFISQSSQVTSISGSVSFYDYSANGQLIPVENVDVFIGNGFDPSTSNYTYTLKTTSDGQFRLNNILNSDLTSLRYYLRNNYQLNGKNVLIEKRLSAQTSNLGNVVLIPKEVPGIVTLKVVDANGTPQPNVQVCLFSNQTQFQQSQACEGSFISMKTNIYGKIFVNDLLPSTTYYAKGLVIVENVTLPVKVQESFIVSQSFPQEIPLKLQ